LGVSFFSSSRAFCQSFDLKSGVVEVRTGWGWRCVQRGRSEGDDTTVAAAAIVETKIKSFDWFARVVAVSGLTPTCGAPNSPVGLTPVTESGGQHIMSRERKDCVIYKLRLIL
jgi:hypothetical protein